MGCVYDTINQRCEIVPTKGLLNVLPMTIANS